MEATELDCQVDRLALRLRAIMREVQRRHEIAQADAAATQIRPWFYQNYVRDRVGGTNPGVLALLANQAMTMPQERCASWRLIRDLCWRLRHGSEYPRLSSAARHTIRVAIRAELRRLDLRAQAEVGIAVYRDEAAE